MSADGSIGEARRRSALARALGPAIAEALDAQDVVEALINEDGWVWFDRAGKGLVQTDYRLSANDRETAIRLIAHAAGQAVSEQDPSLAAILPDSAARVQAVLPPISSAPLLAIRKRAPLVFGLEAYVAAKIATKDQAALLASAVKARRNIVVAGSTGSGKTTLLNALLAEPSFAAARVLLLEDTAELQCTSANCVRLLTKISNPCIDMAALVRMSLRLRPDRIVVGEVRDGAALDVLKAWNTGHPGGLLSVHANSAKDAVARLEDLCLEARSASPQRLIASAIDLIVFISRTGPSRRIETIAQLSNL